MATRKTVFHTTLGILVVLAAVVYFVIPEFFSKAYVSEGTSSASSLIKEEISSQEKVPLLTPVRHHATPDAVKGLYMTSWVAGTQSMRDHILRIAKETEVNTIVFDIKDDTGKVSYPVEDPYLKDIESSERRIPDLRAFTNLLHDQDLYIVGRIAVFQDPYFVSTFPEYAVKKASDTTKVWKDRKGLSWLDAGEEKVWEYVIAIARDAYAQGVDEINFDYIRFPSDGNMQDIYFPKSQGKVKSDVVTSFWEYVNKELHGTGPVISADLFGMTTTNTDDLNIGQLLEPALLNFDYVMPMVYPSHYPKTWNGFSDPELYPYETIQIAMDKAVERARAIGVSETKLRPWLQDFGLRTKYGPKEVRDQIKATYDVGLTSWVLWDPSNKFTEGALLKEGN